MSEEYNEEQKSFTQEDVDRIVGDRLSREKSKYTDYEDTKGILEELNAYGFQGNAREVRAAVKTQREENQKQEELQELQEEANQSGTSPELLAEIRELKTEISSYKKDKQEKFQAEADAVKAQENIRTMVDEFSEDYPNIDLEKLNKNEDFIDFLQESNPNMSLSKVYARYSKYSNGAADKAAAKIQSNLERSTSSGKAKGTNNSFGLSADQKNTVDEYNASCKNSKEKLTYEEFSQNLRR